MTLATPPQQVCPRCGHMMHAVPDSEWHLFDRRTIEYRCPNCLHVETVEVREERDR